MARLVSELAFVTAGDVRRAVVAERAQVGALGARPAPRDVPVRRHGLARGRGQGRGPPLPGLSVVKAPKVPADPKRWLRKARGKSEAAQAPPSRKQALDPAAPRPWLKPR